MISGSPWWLIVIEFLCFICLIYIAVMALVYWASSIERQYEEIDEETERRAARLITESLKIDSGRGGMLN